jgi:hypothetical protein
MTNVRTAALGPSSHCTSSTAISTGRSAAALRTSASRARGEQFVRGPAREDVGERWRSGAEEGLHEVDGRDIRHCRLRLGRPRRENGEAARAGEGDPVRPQARFADPGFDFEHERADPVAARHEPRDRLELLLAPHDQPVHSVSLGRTSRSS